MERAEVAEITPDSRPYPLFDEYTLWSTEVCDFGLQARFVIKHIFDKIGELMIHYTPDAETVHVGLISIPESHKEHRKQGVGTAIYRLIPDLPVPPMRWHTQERATFISSDNMYGGSRPLWRSLVRHGLAEEVGAGYVMKEFYETAA